MCQLELVQLVHKVRLCERRTSRKDGTEDEFENCKLDALAKACAHGEDDEVVVEAFRDGACPCKTLVKPFLIAKLVAPLSIASAGVEIVSAKFSATGSRRPRRWP